MTKKLMMMFVLAFGLVAAVMADVKLVNVGSNLPKLDELKANISKYEQQAPFDGVMIMLGGSSDVFNPAAFTDGQKNEMRAAGEVYKKIPFKKWTYNFLGVLADQNRPLWFDDDYWKNVTANWTTAAQLAKSCGMVGICLDPEGYGVYPVESFWRSESCIEGKGSLLNGGGQQPADPLHSQAQYIAEARKRGKQIGDAIFAVFPEMVLWSFYFWSFNGADLMGAFCNGLLEAMPPKARLIDGDEWSGYTAQNAAAYERMKERNETGCGLLDEALKAKHMQQGGFAPAFYMDAYAFAANNDCLKPTIDSVENRVEYFAQNFEAALSKATGGHIWIYGEQLTWWPAEGGSVVDWETLLPGIHKVLFDRKRSDGEESKITVAVPSPKVNLRLFKAMSH